MAKTLHFKNEGKYEKWLDYDKIHHLHKPGHELPKIDIGGKPHKVEHK